MFEGIIQEHGNGVVAIADTSFLLYPHNLDVMLIKQWLMHEGIPLVVPEGVEMELKKLTRSSSPRKVKEKYAGLDFAIDINPVLDKKNFYSIVRNFAEGHYQEVKAKTLTLDEWEPLYTPSLEPLISATDVYLIKLSLIAANNFGTVHLVTSDYGLANVVNHIAELRGKDISATVPENVVSQLSSFLPDLGIDLLLPNSVVKELNGALNIDDWHRKNVHLHSRSTRYNFGQTTVDLDIATVLHRSIWRRDNLLEGEYVSPVLVQQPVPEQWDFDITGKRMEESGGAVVLNGTGGMAYPYFFRFDHAGVATPLRWAFMRRPYLPQNLDS